MDNFPLIVSQIAQDLPLSEREILVLLKTAPNRYKVHQIVKRHGRGMRTIAQPTSEIKALQRWALERYIERLPVHPAATAYRKGKSIKDHASPHASNGYLLKLDFEDFFPSIKVRDFVRHIRRHLDVPAEEAQLLGSLFFWNAKRWDGLQLSIGAPSSPAISNSLLFSFDEELFGVCTERNVEYTRYADDIALSTNVPKALDEVYLEVQRICTGLPYPRLRLNQQKTVFASKKTNRHLTGLVLSNDGRASLGHEKKRRIRAMTHHFKLGRLEPESVAYLRGLIAYAMSIERPFVDSIRRMIGDDSFDQLMGRQHKPD